MGAIYDPILGKLRSDEAAAVAASGIPYDPTTSGLTADDVQEAIDELAALSGSKADLEFVDGDLTAGELTVTGLDPIAAIVDNNGVVVAADDITYGATNTTVDLSSFGTLTGTWKVKFAVGPQGPAGTVDDDYEGTNALVAKMLFGGI
jgi:hypothetical protein